MQDSIDALVIKFCQLTGSRIRVLKKELKHKGEQIDAEIELKTGSLKTTFYVEQKNEMRQAMLPALIERMKPASDWLLVCKYIPGPLKEELRNMGINYLEEPGNCYIRTENLMFFVNDQSVTSYRLVKEGKIWSPAGLKFIFTLLQAPAILNLPYRRLAFTAKIALGNIGPFIDELEENGFLAKGVKNKKNVYYLQNRNELLRKWSELYASILKPKLRKGKFRFLDVVDWKKRIKNIPAELYWGGEPAGAELTGHLTPEKYTMYTNMDIPKVMKDLKLVPDTNGELEIFEAFWNMDVFNIINQTVPPVIVYADLINSLDSRNRETAERIKTKYLDYQA